jgi:hypothetical protein
MEIVTPINQRYVFSSHILSKFAHLLRENPEFSEAEQFLEDHVFRQSHFQYSLVISQDSIPIFPQEINHKMLLRSVKSMD